MHICQVCGYELCESALCLHSVYIVSTLCLHSVYTVSTLCLHCVYTLDSHSNVACLVNLHCQAVCISTSVLLSRKNSRSKASLMSLHGSSHTHQYPWKFTSMSFFFFRNKLRSRPALMSPPPNAFSPTLGPSPGSGSANRLGNQENLAIPYASLPAARTELTSAVKRSPSKPETLARRRVLPARQDQQPYRLGSREGPGDSAISSSSSPSSSSSSSRDDSARAGQRRASGQGTKAKALKAAPRTRTTKDSQVIMCVYEILHTFAIISSHSN